MTVPKRTRTGLLILGVVLILAGLGGAVLGAVLILFSDSSGHSGVGGGLAGLMRGSGFALVIASAVAFVLGAVALWRASPSE